MRVPGPQLRWRRQEGGGRRMRHGQEVAVQANEGDPHAPRRIRVHQDARLPRGGYPEGSAQYLTL